MDIYVVLFCIIVVFAFISFLACIVSCCRMYDCFCGAFERLGMVCGCIEKDYAYYENGCCGGSPYNDSHLMFEGCRVVPYERDKVVVHLCCRKSEATCMNPTCTICLDDFIAAERIILCPCGHCYHKKCIKSWLCVKNTCPLCKISIGRRDILTERSPLIPPV